MYSAVSTRVICSQQNIERLYLLGTLFWSYKLDTMKKQEVPYNHIQDNYLF